MIELEKTYLAKYLPEGLKDCRFKEIIDIYFPDSEEHPKIRLRKNGETYELTKKEPVDGDTSSLDEQTIILTKEEFESLSQQIKGRKTHKLRYYYPHENQTAEFDVFLESLAGLVVIDFEFETEEDKKKFTMPDFCLVDVTGKEFIAGGMICGKEYKDIEPFLDELGYGKLTL